MFQFMKERERASERGRGGQKSPLPTLVFFSQNEFYLNSRYTIINIQNINNKYI